MIYGVFNESSFGGCMLCFMCLFGLLKYEMELFVFG